MDSFGYADSRCMPEWLFSRALSLDHTTAIRGNPEKQNHGVCPRHWYVDAVFECVRCGEQFTWTAGEQKAWFEDYFFWIDSVPRHCMQCGADRRRIDDLRKEYDSTVAAARENGTSEQKRRIIEIVTELEIELGKLPEKMIETKKLFKRLIENRSSA